MNRREILQATAALPALALIPACASTDAIMTNTPTPPVARIEPKTIEQLGRTRVDNYAWLKDDNWQEVMRDPSVLKPEIRAYLDAENAYREAMMAPTTALQERIYQEMRGRTKEDDSSVPSPDGPWEYYRRFEAGAQHPKYARRPRGAEGPGKCCSMSMRRRRARRSTRSSPPNTRQITRCLRMRSMSKVRKFTRST